MYANNDILFPYHVIATLKNLRGEVWQNLVRQVMDQPQNDERTLAFMLMMVRLNGCMTCETDSYRAMRGCATCTRQTLRRFKGSDEELVTMYEQALFDIRQFAQDQTDYAIQTDE